MKAEKERIRSSNEKFSWSFNVLQMYLETLKNFIGKIAIVSDLMKTRTFSSILLQQRIFKWHNFESDDSILSRIISRIREKENVKEKEKERKDAKGAHIFELLMYTLVILTVETLRFLFYLRSIRKCIWQRYRKCVRCFLEYLLDLHQ